MERSIMSIDTIWYDAYDTSGSVSIFDTRLKAEVKREQKKLCTEELGATSADLWRPSAPKEKNRARFSDSYAKGCILGIYVYVLLDGSITPIGFT